MLVPLVSAAIIALLCGSPAPATQNAPTTGERHIGLIAKDAAFHVVTGGASGDVWFNASGPAFSFRLTATNLTPRVSYLIELNVDNATYEVESRAADARGAIKLDTTLTQFATGACIGGDYVPPRPLRGSHEIKFLIKRDGNPVSGTRRTRSTSVAPPALPCHGNGDENFAYALFEDNVARYTGTR